MAGKPKGIPRSYARQAAVQALYQALVNDEAPEISTLKFITDETSNKMDTKYFSALVAWVTQEADALDVALSDAVDRSLGSIDPVELAILRLATYELMYRPAVPYRVILNEAVELAKDMGGEMGHKYVNGVLDKVVKKVREAEFNAKRK